MTDESKRMSFSQMCAALPEDFSWGDSLTPDVFQHIEAAILQATTRDAPSADAVDEIVPWWKVMELAEKHGKGWSQYSGWAFMNDDDLHAFAEAIAASEPREST